MWLVNGLGNPGPQYAFTRHNAGFIMLDLLAAELGVSFSQTKFKGEAVKAQVSGEPCLLFKPMTFMNRSGQPVREVAGFYKITPDQMIVIHDDIDMEFGKVKLREGGGGHGGNNGVRSMMDELSSPAFTRIKVGIGRPSVGSPSHWVLQPFSEEEQTALREAVYPEVKERLYAVLT